MSILIYQTRPSDVEQDNNVIPETVITFLQTVLTGKTEYSQPLKIIEQVTSWRNWWQDQTTKTNHVNPCSQVSDWEYKCDAFHRSTGLLCFKNTHFGNWHGTLPSKAGESQTGVALSRNIYQGVFVMLAWDNRDRPDETTSGEGTSHRVNGMAAQSRNIGPMAQRNMKWTQTNKVQDAMSRTWDGCLLWFQTPKTTKPSAVGLDLTLSSAMTSLWCGILRLPTINAPATTMSRVNEVLTQPLNIMETLELEESVCLFDRRPYMMGKARGKEEEEVCVFDQVFYVNTADITWKHDQLKNIIFRMVAYHTIPYHTISFETS